MEFIDDRITTVCAGLEVLIWLANHSAKHSTWIGITKGRCGWDKASSVTERKLVRFHAGPFALPKSTLSQDM